ncbi:MAG TPA: serine hydrolase [Candidatus Nanoarchaeia archaeon]|nr:serine hydrolase [Candidatus Nanoarchaeia archaeon]
MIIRLKWVVAVQVIIILVLLAVTANYYLEENKIEKARNGGLLSQRIYSGILEPKSFLIVSFAPLKEKINAHIQKNNLNVSVYVENFRNGAYMGINERTGFFPASLIKLPIAILIAKKIENGELRFDTMLSIYDSDRTSSFGELYKIKENQLPVGVLLEKMLKESDNTAYRILLRQVDAGDFQLILDYYGIDVNADFEEGETAERPNLLSPKAMSTLFSSLYFSTVLEPENSERLLSLLSDSAFDVKKAANIPNDVAIAHKFGETYYVGYRYFHDCGIMYIGETRIFYCIMTEDLNEKQATEAISFIVNETYHYVKETKARFEDYKQ